MPNCDILILIATQTEEEQLVVVANELELEWEFDGKYYYLGEVGSTRVAAVRSGVGPFYRGGSAATAILSMSDTNATALACVGMAFGMSRRTQPPGTILVSKMVLPYDDREIYCEPGKTVEADYTRVKTHKAKDSLLKMLDDESQKDEWQGKVRFGAILTGGAKIRCAAFRDELRDKLGGRGALVIGGEMEAVGLLGCCERKKANWVVVKGVSDYADHIQSADVATHRELACHESIMFFLSAVMNQEIPL